MTQKYCLGTILKELSNIYIHQASDMIDLNLPEVAKELSNDASLLEETIPLLKC